MTRASDEGDPRDAAHDRTCVRLYLKNVPYRAVEADVQRFCEAVADGSNAYEVVLPKERHGKRRPMGIAFVTLILPLGVDPELWRELDSRYLAGRKITVELENGRRNRPADQDNGEGIEHGEQSDLG